MKAISYSLFGYNNKYWECHDFDTFIRYFSIVIRANKILFLDWKMVLFLEKKSYESHYRPYFDHIGKVVQIVLRDSEPLCKAMLWRLEPVQYAEYTLCRDLDSLPTHRERQAVEEWLSDGTAAHSINDSEGHGIPMLGGMIGFKKNAFPAVPITGDFTIKGSDQEFINYKIRPRLKNITEHRLKGMAPDPANKYTRTEIVDRDLGLNSYRDCDNLVNHIGQGGFYLTPEFNRDINKHYAGAVNYWTTRGDAELNNYLMEIEKQFPVFYWAQ